MCAQVVRSEVTQWTFTAVGEASDVKKKRGSTAFW